MKITDINLSALTDPTGVTFTLENQKYTAIRIENDAPQPGLSRIIWKTNCPICGREFELWSQTRITGLVRRCPEHRTLAMSVKTELKRRQKLANNLIESLKEQRARAKAERRAANRTAHAEQQAAAAAERQRLRDERKAANRAAYRDPIPAGGLH